MVTSGGRRYERLEAAFGHSDDHVVEDPHGLSWQVEFVRRVDADTVTVPPDARISGPPGGEGRDALVMNHEDEVVVHADDR